MAASYGWQAMDRRYRRLQILILVALVIPTLLAGGATAESPALPRITGTRPDWSNPNAGNPGVAPAVTRVALGAFDAPAGGASVDNGVPAEVPLTDGVPRSSKVRTLSAVRVSTAPFSAIGVTWQETGKLGPLSVAVRAHSATGWGTWQAMSVADTDRDAASGTRGGVDLLWTGAGDGVQVSVTSAAGKTPHDIAADLIDPSTAPTDAAAGTLAPAGAAPVPGAPVVAMPPIHSRAEWGADERDATWQPQDAPQVKAVVLHDTATTNDYKPGDVPKILRAVFRYQAVSRGWGDIGYQVLVDRFGRLWEGRAGGLSRPVIGAQSGGFNAGTAGIAYLGDAARTPITPAAIEATARYAAWKFTLGPTAIDPRGTVGLTGGGPTSRYPAGTTITVPRVFPHRQTSPTDGPGDKGMLALPEIRDRAAQIMGSLTQPGTVRARFATWRPSDASFRVLGNPSPVFVGSAGDIPVPADYDGDGATDFAVWTPATATWRIRRSSDGASVTAVFGQAGDVPVPADYSGDGHADLAVWRPSNGWWYAQGMTPFGYGQSGDKPVPADYTGDGIVDAAVYRPSNGTWYLRGAGTFRLGEPWHVPVPADFNGDGIADPASWSPVSQRFFIRGMAPVSYGEQGDIPVPGAYDGSGHADFAVYHRTSAGRAEFRIKGLGSFDVGSPGDVPVPLR
jgi:hypothetical protein